MKVFVTGGSGFVGGHVIERLAARYEVLAMARSERSAEAVRRFGATPVTCDLDTLDATHLAGVDAVVHCAAYVEEWGTRDDFWRGNVDGTTRCLDAARRAGVRRFVHIGTEAALFDGHDLVDLDETAPYPARQRYLYSETKAEAERRVLAANAEGFTTISLRPRFVWGPRDTTVLPAVLRMAREGVVVARRRAAPHVDGSCEQRRPRGGARADGGRRGTGLLHRRRGDADAAGVSRGAGEDAQGVTLPERSMPGAVARPLAAAVEGAWRLPRGARRRRR